MVCVDDSSEQPHNASRLQWLTLGLPVQRFHSWHAPVLAPIDGAVTSVVNDLPDKRWSHRLFSTLIANVIEPRRHRSEPIKQAGNHIVVNSGKAYVVLAHLSTGSVTVELGEEVTIGQVVGLVGNSGTSLSPHLHFHISDRPAVDNVIPFVVEQFELRLSSGWEPQRDLALPRGGLVRS
jgi:murein DD-endopeptidase MepM/ murein hydrolase activator NlpD